MSAFFLSHVKVGDRVQLRFTGDHGVAHRYGDTWATVVRDSQHATAWKKTTRITVD